VGRPPRVIRLPNLITLTALCGVGTSNVGSISKLCAIVHNRGNGPDRHLGKHRDRWVVPARVARPK